MDPTTIGIGLVIGLLVSAVIGYFLVSTFVKKANKGKLDEANSKADLIIAEAKVNAKKVISDAEHKADRLVSQAEGKHDKIKQRKDSGGERTI